MQINVLLHYNFSTMYQLKTLTNNLKKDGIQICKCVNQKKVLSRWSTTKFFPQGRKGLRIKNKAHISQQSITINQISQQVTKHTFTWLNKSRIMNFLYYNNLQKNLKDRKVEADWSCEGHRMANYPVQTP